MSDIKIIFNKDFSEERVTYPELYYKGQLLSACSLFPLGGKYRNNGAELTLIGDDEKAQFEKDVNNLTPEFLTSRLNSQDDTDGEFD